MAIQEDALYKKLSMRSTTCPLQICGNIIDQLFHSCGSIDAVVLRGSCRDKNGLFCEQTQQEEAQRKSGDSRVFVAEVFFFFLSNIGVFGSQRLT